MSPGDARRGDRVRHNFDIIPGQGGEDEGSVEQKDGPG